MKIEWDKEKNVITVGKAVFKNYTRFQNSAAFANFVLRQNDLPTHLNSHGKNGKEDNKLTADALCCSRSVLFKHYNALQLKVFVAPVYDILKKVGYSRNGFSAEALRKIHTNKEKLQAVYNDGLYNILPIVCETGKSPQELKKELKNAWKTISKNSLNKNKYLARAIKGYDDPEIRLNQLKDIPSTVLKNFHATRPEVQAYVAKNFKGLWSHPQRCAGDIRMYSDTTWLATQLGEDTSNIHSWTPRRMKEEHDRMSKEINARKYSKDLFDSVKDISVKCVELEGYKATLLDNAFAIAEEGTSMGHCVGLYADSVREGDYLVYSVTKDGERSSTIGIVRQSGRNQATEQKYTTCRLQQHYGKYNQAVTEETEKLICSYVIQKLNKGEEK
jgi:hypothetical protein